MFPWLKMSKMKVATFYLDKVLLQNTNYQNTGRKKLENT